MKFWDKTVNSRTYNKVYNFIYLTYWKIGTCETCNGMGDEFQADHEWRPCWWCKGKGYTKESLPALAKEWAICKYWTVRRRIRRAFLDARIKVNIRIRRYQEEKVGKAIIKRRGDIEL